MQPNLFEKLDSNFNKINLESPLNKFLQPLAVDML